MTAQPPRLPDRKPDSHKGDYGRVLVVAGSRSMPGAAALAGKAALRGGAGLVQLAVPEVCLQTVASFEPSYMTYPLPCDNQGRISAAARPEIAELAQRATVMAVGPGLGRSPELTELLAWIYAELDKPAVFDADGLNALAERTSILQSPRAVRLLTPHPGEFDRLRGSAAGHAERSRSRDQRDARQLAARWGVVILLKGHQTFITDGKSSWHNATGCPGMATGGTGDVLTGLVAALLAQGMPPNDAARLAAHVHGRAGELASRQMGETSMIASDLLAYLGEAFRMPWSG